MKCIFNTSNTTTVFNLNENYEEDFDYYSIEYKWTLLFQLHQMIAIVFGGISMLLNLVVLKALYHIQNRITTHYQVIISLALSEILVGGSVLFHYINHMIAVYTRNNKDRCVHFSLCV